MRTAEQWYALLQKCGVKPKECELWAPVFSDEIDDRTFSAGEEEIDDFLGQILHESALLTRLTENLNYTTPERIQAVWPARFSTPQEAALYVKNPEALANKVYGGRMGNSHPGDGFKYAGRGLLQVTGRTNYIGLGQVLKLNLLDQPQLLAEPVWALRASIAWWEKNVPDSVMGNIQRVTRTVNGGQEGLADRERLTKAVTA